MVGLKVKNIFIYSEHVCEKRKLDGKRIELYFKRNKYNIVDSPTKADIILLSSCGTTDDYTKKIDDMVASREKDIMTI